MWRTLSRPGGQKLATKSSNIACFLGPQRVSLSSATCIHKSYLRSNLNSRTNLIVGAAKKAKSGGGSKQRGSSGAKPQPEQHLTAPLQQSVVESRPSEPSPTPIYGTWAGHVAGMWVGRVQAFSPGTGLAEPLALDEDGNRLMEATQCCVEERAFEEDVGGFLTRWVAAEESAFSRIIIFPDTGPLKSSALGENARVVQRTKF
jgi:hypothetical protein